MVRRGQAPAFRLDGLDGGKIVECVGCADGSGSRNILMLFVALDGAAEGHRVFLDAGIGFWEQLSRADAFAEFGDVPQVDFGQRWSLIGATILSARCVGTEIDAPGLSAFQIATSAGTLVYRYADQTDMESVTILERRM